MTASTLSPECLVAIPKEVADSLRWRPGRKLALIPKGNGVLLLAIPEREELVGLTRGPNVEDYRDRTDRY